jgi:hypothetical protein
MRIIPPHPEQGLPERKATIRTRLASGLGGIALMAGGYEVAAHTNFWTQLNEWGRIGFSIGLLAVSFPLVAELQERFGKGGGKEFRRDDGGDWPPDDPEPAPQGPDLPEIEVDFTDIESILQGQQKELVSV